MSQRARHTASIVITMKVISELVDYCSDPILLRDILRRAAGLLSVPRGDERMAAVAALEEFCRAAPCIRWQPEHRTRHVDVPLRNMQGHTAVISVARVLWTAFYVVPEQGDNRGLGTEDEILHTCGTRGQANTGYGTCLNPGHMLRANEALRIELARTRRVLRTHNIAQVSA